MAIRAAIGAFLLFAGATGPASLDKLRSAAQGGDSEAAFTLGRAYKLGDGAPADLKEAARWLERAARSGHSRAGDELGLVLFQDGHAAEALPWLKKAAERGDPRAQYALGTIYFAGQVVPLDSIQAKLWMRRAAKAGLPAAAEALAIMEKPLAATPKPERAYEIVTVVPRPAPVKAPPARAASGWQVQMGAFALKGSAQRFWRAVKGEMDPKLKVRFLADGHLTKLRLAPFATKEAAARFCTAQRKLGRDCLVLAKAGQG